MFFLFLFKTISFQCFLNYVKKIILENKIKKKTINLPINEWIYQTMTWTLWIIIIIIIIKYGLSFKLKVKLKRYLVS